MFCWVFGSALLRLVLVGTAKGSTSIYGPLAAPIAVLLWLYLLSIAVLIGAALNASFDQLWPQKELTRARLERLRRLKLENVLPWRSSLERRPGPEEERSAQTNDPAEEDPQPNPRRTSTGRLTSRGGTFRCAVTGRTYIARHGGRSLTAYVPLAPRKRSAACSLARSGSSSSSPTSGPCARRTAPACSARSRATVRESRSRGSGSRCAAGTTAR